MLGGSFWIAGLRNIMGAGLMMSVFLLLDRPKLSMKNEKDSLVLYYFCAVACIALWILVSG